MVQSIIVWLAMLATATYFITYFEAYDIERDIPITKKKKRIRAGIFLACNLLVGIGFYTIFVMSYLNGLALGLAFHTVYWILFDSMLNYHRGLDFFYISDNDRDDSDVWPDKVFHLFGKKHSGHVQFGFKILLLTTLIILV